MAHSLSAKKRVRQNTSRNLINRARKSKVKSQIKKLEQAFISGDAAAAKQQYLQMVKKLDKVAATSSMHKKTAARKKSRMAKRLRKLAAAKQG